MKLIITIEAEQVDMPDVIAYLKSLYEEGCGGCAYTTKNGHVDIDIDWEP